MKWTIRCIQWVPEYVDIEVEAGTEKEAISLAAQEAADADDWRDHSAHWRFEYAVVEPGPLGRIAALKGEEQ